MDNAPLVSVIIPTYNGERYLEEAILSVFNQTYKDYELIVVDDGSVTNNVAKICDKYKDRLTYIRQENKGLSLARNEGINNSQGEYIAFIDDDDLWLPEKLTKQINYYEQLIREGKNVGLVYTGLQNIMDNGDNICKTLYKSSGNNYNTLLFQEFIGTPSSVIIQKRILDDIGLFDKRLKTNQDSDLWLRIAKKYEIYSLNGFLTKYRIRHNSLGRNALFLVDDKDLMLKDILAQEMQEKSINSETCFKLIRCYKKESAYVLKNAAYCYLFTEKKGKMFREYIRNGYKYDKSFFGFKVWVYYILSFFSPRLCKKIKKIKKIEKQKDLILDIKELKF